MLDIVHECSLPITTGLDLITFRISFKNNLLWLNWRLSSLSYFKVKVETQWRNTTQGRQKFTTHSKNWKEKLFKTESIIKMRKNLTHENELDCYRLKMRWLRLKNGSKLIFWDVLCGQASIDLFNHLIFPQIYHTSFWKL